MTFKPSATPVGPVSVHDVIVAGRGAIGCAAALGLAQAGLRVALAGPPVAAEPTPPDDWDARIYALSPASRALLERLRVWQALEADRVAAVRDMRIYPNAGPSAPELHFDAESAQTEALAFTLENRNLMQALERGLGFAGVQVVGQRVVAVDPFADRIEVVLDDGARLSARLLVAADGAQSPVRGLLGMTADAFEYPQRAVVANFETAHLPSDCAYQWFGDHGILALLPLPGQRCSIVWSAPPALADELMALDPPALAARVSQVSQYVLGELRAMEPARCHRLHRVVADRMAGPRAVLLGDAAHVVHPLAGQGMNLGLGDVGELLAVIAAREPFRDLGERLLLRRYERARREPVLAMKWTTDGLQRLFDPEQQPGLPPLLQPLRAVRELGWQAVAATGWLRRRLIRHAVS